ncbi:hypothetical protein BKA81DRAFT_179226 [Phyllosticta paracitricarpa]
MTTIRYSFRYTRPPLKSWREVHALPLAEHAIPASGAALCFGPTIDAAIRVYGGAAQGTLPSLTSSLFSASGRLGRFHEGPEL